MYIIIHVHYVHTCAQLYRNTVYTVLDTITVYMYIVAVIVTSSILVYVPFGIAIPSYM